MATRTTATLSHITKLDTAGIGAKSKAYDSVQEAARATLRGIKGKDLQEHAGVILKDPSGKYYATDPTVSAIHDQFALKVQLQKGWSIAGVYHTHPGADQLGQYFSPNDLNVANQLKVPSYIRFLKDDSIRSYTPGQTSTRRIDYPGSPFGLHVAKGDPVADPPPPTAPVTAGTQTVPTNNVLPVSSHSGS